MTEQEKNEIVDLLYRRLEADWHPPREDTQSKLSEVRNKWFRDSNGGGQGSLMTQAIGSPQVAWVIWEAVRKLTCQICGVSYVRQIKDIDRANKAAEELCSLIYRLAKEKA